MKSWHGANQKAWLHRNPVFFYCLKDYYLHKILWAAEPLNFIDVYSRMQIEQLITEFAPTMLLVEHDNVFRDTVASNIVNI